jgi:Lar family restriction alleviation protein
MTNTKTTEPAKVVSATDLLGLLPCPFCGTTEDDDRYSERMLIHFEQYIGVHRIKCNACGGMGPWHLRSKKAIGIWNKRPENAKLREILKKVEFLAYQPEEVRSAINSIPNAQDEPQREQNI